jgi:hypothetical protein
MTPERTARLVVRWVRFYTRDLPAPTADRRVDEIGADLHDHIAHERARGTSEQRIAAGIVSRMVRGLAADISWRGGRKATTAARPAMRVVRVVALILLVPLVAMLFTDAVAWGPADFVVAGTLLGGTGLLFQAAAKNAGDTPYRVAAGAALASALLLIWVSLAVGVIGGDGDPADLMYAGVLAVGVIGAVDARLRPHGMARALLAMALAQALVAAIALIAGKHHAAMSSAFELVAVNAFFAGLFAGSAGLFRYAAQQRASRP